MVHVQLIIARTSSESVHLWVMTPKISMDYGVLARYGFFAHFPDYRFGGPQKPMGFCKVWVITMMGYDRVDCTYNVSFFGRRPLRKSIFTGYGIGFKERDTCSQRGTQWHCWLDYLFTLLWTLEVIVDVVEL